MQMRMQWMVWVALWLGLAAPVQAEMPAPQAIVQSAADQMLEALSTHKAELETNPNLIFSLVEDILMPHFDFVRMSRSALGRNWRDMNAAQRDAFVEEFRLLLIRTYSTAMLEYTDEEIRMLPFRDDLNSGRVTVTVSIIRANGPAIPMALSLYLNDAQAWKVYDVQIEGISLVTNYRNTFTNDIRRGGVDKLIRDLAVRNERVRS